MLSLDEYFARVERNLFIPEPPPERIFIGVGAFRQIGCAMAAAIIDRVGLAPGHSVLDIGSGIGRLALPLTQWLNGDAEYVGIDIVTEGVSWCIENITSKYPNFRFVHADLKNEYYNPTGQGTTAGFRLQGAPARFDVAIFTSVFTHLDATDCDAWLGIVAKALKPGGKIFSTWFVMDEETQANCRAGRSTLGLGYEDQGVFWQSPERNPGAVGYAPWKMAEMFERHGFELSSLGKGEWCEREVFSGGYQDEVVLTRLSGTAKAAPADAVSEVVTA